MPLRIKNICKKSTENEQHLCFDLSECSISERGDFILDLITDHHDKSVTIDVTMKKFELEADVCVCWEDGHERSAQKVIKRIEMLSASK